MWGIHIYVCSPYCIAVVSTKPIQYFLIYICMYFNTYISISKNMFLRSDVEATTKPRIFKGYLYIYIYAYEYKIFYV